MRASNIQITLGEILSIWGNDRAGPWKPRVLDQGIVQWYEVGTPEYVSADGALFAFRKLEKGQTSDFTKFIERYGVLGTSPIVHIDLEDESDAENSGPQVQDASNLSSDVWRRSVSLSEDLEHWRNFAGLLNRLFRAYVNEDRGLGVSDGDRHTLASGLLNSLAYLSDGVVDPREVFRFWFDIVALEARVNLICDPGTPVAFCVDVDFGDLEGRCEAWDREALDHQSILDPLLSSHLVRPPSRDQRPSVLFAILILQAASYLTHIDGIFVCDYCEEAFQPIDRRSARIDKRKYCSKECRDAVHRETVRKGYHKNRKR